MGYLLWKSSGYNSVFLGFTRGLTPHQSGSATKKSGISEWFQLRFPMSIWMPESVSATHSVSEDLCCYRSEVMSAIVQYYVVFDHKDYRC